MLVVVGSDPPGLPEPSDPGLSPGNRSRREFVVVPGGISRFRPSRRLIPDRSVPCVRCDRRRVCPRRGCRGSGAQAVDRCTARRGSGACGHLRFCGQPGRPIQRADGPQPSGPDGGAACRLHQRGDAAQRGRLRRSARNRDAVGRPDRSPRSRNGAGSRPAREFSVAHRLCQDQPRSHRGCGWNRGLHQDGAGCAAWPDSAKSALRNREPAHSLYRLADESR